TDKATMEVEAVDEGTLGKIVVPEGAQGVKVNAVIALLLEEGEDAKSLAGAGKPAEKKAAEKPTPAAAPAPQPAAAAAPAPVSPKTAPPAAASTNGTGAGNRIFASPLAKRMAEQAGLDLAQLTGSGPQGRVVKSDIEAALGKPQAPRAPAGVAAAAAAPGAAPPRI